MSLVENPQHHLPSNEIKVKAHGGLARYVQYAIKMFRSQQKTLVLKGAGTATSKVLHLTEILKRRIGDLHQTNSVYSVEVDDRRENPSKDGKRRMSVFETVLSVEPLEKENVGYQEPVPREERAQRTPHKRSPRNYYRQRENFYEMDGPRYHEYRPRYGPPRRYDDFYGKTPPLFTHDHAIDYDQGYNPEYSPRYDQRRGGYRGRRFGNRYGTAYKPRRYQNQWVQHRESRMETMSQGPSQRYLLFLFSHFLLCFMTNFCV